MIVGEEDITERFEGSQTVQQAGVKGLQLFVYHTERWSDQLTMSVIHDSEPLRCVASVTGLAANLSSVKVIVNCKCSYTVYLLASESSEMLILEGDASGIS